MPGISLIIPTYNRAEFLKETLQSIAELNCMPGVDWEVLVIDNNCTDHTAEIATEAAKTFPCDVRHIVEYEQGLCFGRNRGIVEAKYEHLGYLDDDIRVAPSWLVSYFEAVNDYGADAVAGPVFPMFNQPKPPFVVGRALDMISSSYSRKGEEIQVLPERTAHELPGCNFGVRKAVAESLDGFDNSLDRIGSGLLAGGDFDFGLRLVAAGHRTVFHPGCGIEHLIIPEKLTKPYLRRRAYGLGATIRLMWGNESQFPLRKQVRHYAGVCRLGMSAVTYRLLGKGSESFDREIETLQALGYIVTSPRRHPKERS